MYHGAVIYIIYIISFAYFLFIFKRLTTLRLIIDEYDAVERSLYAPQKALRGHTAKIENQKIRSPIGLESGEYM